MANDQGHVAAPDGFSDGTEGGLGALLDDGARTGLSNLADGLDAMTSQAVVKLEERAAGQPSVLDAAAMEMDPGAEPAAMAMAAMSIPGNNDPVANAVWAIAGEEDSEVTFSLNYSDADAGDTHTVFFDFGASISATMAPITDNGDGTYTFHASDTYGDLTAGQYAYENFLYTVTDSAGASSTNTVTIVFEGENDAPVASSVFTETSLSSPYAEVTLAFTDEDQWDSHTVEFFNLSTGAPANEFLVETETVGGETVYRFAPQQDYGFLTTGQSITEAYRYVVTDAAGGTSEALMMLTWNGENDAPVANAMTVTMSEDDPGVSFTLDFDDPDQGDSHSTFFSPVPGAPWTGSTVTDNGDGTFNYTPGMYSYGHLAAGETATETYEYTVTDSMGASSTNTITFTVEGVDDPTTLMSFYPVTLEQGTATLSVPNLIMDQDANEVHLVQFEGQNGFVPWGAEYEIDLEAIFGPDPFRHLGQYDYTTQSISYTVQTGAGELIPGEIFVDFQGLNDAPEADDMTVDVSAADGMVSFMLAGYDPDQFDTLNFSVDTYGGPSGPMDTGFVTTYPDGSFTFDFGTAYDYLGAGQSAVETFTYTVTDSYGAMDTAVGTIVIHGQSAPQTVGDLYLSAHEDDTSATTQLPITAGAGGVDSIEFYEVIGGVRGDQVTPTETQGGSGTDYTFANQTDYQYLTDGQSVTEVYEYVPVDGGVEGDSGRIYVTYEGQNDVPVANDFGITISEDDTTFVFTPDFTDPDAGDMHMVYFMPLMGVMDIQDNYDGTFTLNNFFDAYGYLNDGETATETTYFDVSDSSGAVSSAQLTITITGADEAFV